MTTTVMSLGRLLRDAVAHVLLAGSLASGRDSVIGHARVCSVQRHDERGGGGQSEGRDGRDASYGRTVVAYVNR